MTCIVVRISGALRKLANGKTEIELPVPGNISDCISMLEEQFPGMREGVCDEAGEIRGIINIYLNGDDVRSLQGLATPLKAGDELDIIPAFAAG